MATPKNLSVQKAFALLCSFDNPEEWLSNAKLSRRAGMTEASAHRLIRTLEGIGAVVRDGRGNYRPGMLLATLSKAISVGHLIQATSSDTLVTLASHLKSVVHVGVFENGMVTYTAKIGQQDDVPVPSRVGAQQEAYSCALGKVLLSGLQPQQMEDFLCDGTLVPLTPRTITTADHLRSEIEAVRQCGYALDDREVYPWLSCLAVPVRDAHGGIVAAISLSDNARNLCQTWQEDVIGQLNVASQAISRKLFPTFGAMAR
jgi:DNA-binding IclR family transcriptional regulator